MRDGVLNGYGRVLANGAAVLILGGLAASCSSSAERFTDGLFTGSTMRQAQSVHRPQQPFPGDVSSAEPSGGSYATASAAPTGGVQRSALAPVPGSVAQGEPAPVLAAANPRPLDTMSTGTTAPRRAGSLGTLPAPSGPVRNAAVAPEPARQALPAEKAPIPRKAPVKVAVLPDAPKSRDAEAKTRSGSDAVPARSGSSKPGTYTVAEGDTMNKIARAHGVTAAEIKAANGLRDGAIRIGQVLTIPSGGAPSAKVASAAVDPIETGSAASSAKSAAKPAAATPPTVAAYTPPKKTSIAAVEEDDEATAPDATGIGKMRWPVRGRIVSGFGGGAGRTSDGIDIAVPEGTPVKAAENGVVIYAGNGLKDFGNTVLVRHADGLVTVYGHADQLMVSRGDTVKRGQEIATAGMSGAADSPMLHFEVRKNSAAVDPAKFLE